MKTIPNPSIFPNIVFVEFVQFFILTKFPFPFSYTDDMELDIAVHAAILMLKEGKWMLRFFFFFKEIYFYLKICGGVQLEW